MMRSGMLCTMAFGLLLASGCSKPEFKEFESSPGKYKVQLPGSPKEETKSAAGLTMNIASVQQRDGAYMVMYSDLPISGTESEAEINSRLDGSRNGALGNIRATLSKETKIKLAGKYLGRDIEAELPEKQGALHAKIFIVGKRIYQVMTLGSTKWTYSADSAKFLDSFTLVE